MLDSMLFLHVINNDGEYMMQALFLQIWISAEVVDLASLWVGEFQLQDGEQGGIMRATKWCRESEIVVGRLFTVGDVRCVPERR